MWKHKKMRRKRRLNLKKSQLLLPKKLKQNPPVHKKRLRRLRRQLNRLLLKVAE